MWTLLYHQTFKRRFHILVYLYSQCFYPGQKTSWLGPFFAKNYFETVWLPRCIRVEPFQAVPCYGPSLSKGVRPLVADLWEERLRAPDSLGRNIVICTAIFGDILQYCEVQKNICNNSLHNLRKIVQEPSSFPSINFPIISSSNCLLDHQVFPPMWSRLRRLTEDLAPADVETLFKFPSHFLIHLIHYFNAQARW